MLRYCEKIGRDVIVLPFTNDRTYKLVEPDKRHPTLYAKGVYVAQRMGFDVYASRLVVHAPIGTDYFVRQGIDLTDDDAVNGAAAKIIVEPLPRRDKGYYK